jgi:hypothetical protein
MMSELFNEETEAIVVEDTWEQGVRGRPVATESSEIPTLCELCNRRVFFGVLGTSEKKVGAARHGPDRQQRAGNLQN